MAKYCKLAVGPPLNVPVGLQPDDFSGKLEHEQGLHRVLGTHVKAAGCFGMTSPPTNIECPGWIGKGSRARGSRSKFRDNLVSLGERLGAWLCASLTRASVTESYTFAGLLLVSCWSPTLIPNKQKLVAQAKNADTTDNARHRLGRVSSAKRHARMLLGQSHTEYIQAAHGCQCNSRYVSVCTVSALPARTPRAGLTPRNPFLAVSRFRRHGSGIAGSADRLLLRVRAPHQKA